MAGDNFWRFIHMLSHIPLGFGDWKWANRFHDWSADKWARAFGEKV